tara:strand:- start:619 stop:996 length:378 start_codon:yes stop_codon:yes gene_type:complete
MNKYSFLERGRNQITKYFKDKVVISLKDLENFAPQYQEFITQMKADDEQEGDPEHFFIDHGYSSFAEIVQDQKENYLKEVISEYLFVEFFGCFFNNESEHLITHLLNITFAKESLVLEIGYITRS